MTDDALPEEFRDEASAVLKTICASDPMRIRSDAQAILAARRDDPASLLRMCLAVRTPGFTFGLWEAQQMILAHPRFRALVVARGAQSDDKIDPHDRPPPAETARMRRHMWAVFGASFVARIELAEHKVPPFTENQKLQLWEKLSRLSAGFSETEVSRLRKGAFSVQDHQPSDMAKLCQYVHVQTALMSWSRRERQDEERVRQIAGMLEEIAREYEASNTAWQMRSPQREFVAAQLGVFLAMGAFESGRSAAEEGDWQECFDALARGSLLFAMSVYDAIWHEDPGQGAQYEGRSWGLDPLKENDPGATALNPVRKQIAEVVRSLCRTRPDLSFAMRSLGQIQSLADRSDLQLSALSASFEAIGNFERAWIDLERASARLGIQEQCSESLIVPDVRGNRVRWSSFWAEAAGWARTVAKPNELRKIIEDERANAAEKRLQVYFFPGNLWQSLPIKARHNLINADDAFLMGRPSDPDQVVLCLKRAVEYILCEAVIERVVRLVRGKDGSPKLEEVAMLMEAWRRRTKVKETRGDQTFTRDPNWGDYLRVLMNPTFSDALREIGLHQRDIGFLNGTYLHDALGRLNELRNGAEHDGERFLLAPDIVPVFNKMLGVDNRGIIPSLARIGETLRLKSTAMNDAR